MTRPARRLLAITACAFALVVAAPTAWASDDEDDDREVRARGVCTGPATTKLKLKTDDGRIEAELEVDQNRSGVRWRVVLVHERRVAWRGSARTSGSSGSFSIERRLPDLPGFDTVSARATGPGGLACRVSATLPGD
jgi:hypothetical protein